MKLHPLLIGALVSVASCSVASSGEPAEGTFSATIDGAQYAGSPLLYFPRNTAVIQFAGTGTQLIIKLVAFEKDDRDHTQYVWNFYLPVKTGRYTLTGANEDACGCRMSLENSSFLQYSPGSLNLEVQTLDALHVVATFSGTLALRDEYRVGHPDAKRQLVMTNGRLDVPLRGMDDS